MKGPSYVVNTRLEKHLCNLLNLHSLWGYTESCKLFPVVG